MTFAYDPIGKWTKTHQISLAGKRDEFSREDLHRFSNHCGLKKSKADEIIDRVIDSFGRFDTLCNDFEVDVQLRDFVSKNLRTKL
jgi:serine/threonine-protein kinase HipA